ncbi:omptin family outer membrane protease [Yersinia sp. Marseille-Q3913]|uniref:omptin family outer membrane protease n=1 Tax=Yersinia sp. Marseille-Q3913 TaxID=2830769 RepID=UPI001BB0A8EF|nr:omptin family outer membrane protease [Yersinia sp. Marseille-Q3913]MBS0054951.1 omptin family outer membrane protease [Yersinia sp. Marseille-Q3913]
MKYSTLVKKNASALALLMTCHTAAASYHSGSTDNVTISASLGLLNAESQEFVYQPGNSGHKLSQLDWKAKNIPIIKMDISWDLLSNLTLTAQGWSTLSSGDGAMDNYDWLNQNQTQWSHWSHHEKNNLNYANEIDLNAKFWLLNEKNYRIGVMSGYQRNNHSWAAYGGEINYNNGIQIGKLADSAITIGYKQKFDMPYLGMAGSYRYQDFELTTLLKYSRWVNANGSDEHYLRNLSFKDSSKLSRYYAVTLGAGYYLTPNTKLFVEAAWNRYTEGRGKAQMFNHTTGASTAISDGASIAHQSQTISLGIQYKF